MKKSSLNVGGKTFVEKGMFEGVPYYQLKNDSKIKNDSKFAFIHSLPFDKKQTEVVWFNPQTGEITDEEFKLINEPLNIA